MVASSLLQPVDITAQDSRKGAEQGETSKQVADSPRDMYKIENGLRKVTPYYYTYTTYCKQRWRGRKIIDVFAEEFRDRPLEYYVCHEYLSSDRHFICSFASYWSLLLLSFLSSPRSFHYIELYSPMGLIEICYHNRSSCNQWEKDIFTGNSISKWRRSDT